MILYLFHQFYIGRLNLDNVYSSVWQGAVHVHTYIHMYMYIRGCVSCVRIATDVVHGCFNADINASFAQNRAVNTGAKRLLGHCCAIVAL